MAYDVVATSKSPALIIYLLDVSGSMGGQLDGASKIDHVNQAIEKVLVRMVARSTKGETVAPRYRVAMCAYASAPQDILGKVLAIDELAKKGRPRLSATSSTDTAAAFMWARDLLRQELPNMKGHPAPMVCHLTDGGFTGADPAPIAREIMQMSNGDGNVLVENIYVGPNLTAQPITDASRWAGLTNVGEVRDPNAARLYAMSSPLPQSYAEVIAEEGYNLQAGVPMLIPGTNKELIELAFAMSGATPTS
jgi:hypothetical protein